MRLRFGEFVLDDAARQLSRDGSSVHLTPKALELLEFLVERRPRAVSKEELHEHLWPDTHVTGANLPVLIHEVRDGKFDLWRDFSNIGTVLENAPQWWLEHIATGKPEDFLS